MILTAVAFAAFFVGAITLIYLTLNWIIDIQVEKDHTRVFAQHRIEILHPQTPAEVRIARAARMHYARQEIQRAAVSRR
jgi:hypothetical protein